MVDYLTPNETEAFFLTGIKITGPDTAKKAGLKLIRKGVGTVIIKAGSSGAYLINKETFEHISGFAVETKDTTAAGDSFNAGFAFSILQGGSTTDSVKFANAVAAISTTRTGAQTAMPTAEETKTFLSNRKIALDSLG